MFYIVNVAKRTIVDEAENMDNAQKVLARLLNEYRKNGKRAELTIIESETREELKSDLVIY